MASRLAGALLVALVAGCAPRPPLDIIPTPMERNCGLDAPAGEAPPACDLPTAADVARSCAIRDHLVAGGSQDAPAPEYTARAVSCAFADATRTRATCSMELRTSPAGDDWRATRADLAFGIHAEITELTHVRHEVWVTLTDCTPGR